jgi:DNA-directed RNA polymerase specialized sigma24 family protein
MVDRTHKLTQTLPQLYRFCFLMTGESAKALEAFQLTLREAALLAARAQLPDDRLWCFHEARHHCIAIAQRDAQAEATTLAEEAIAPDAAARVALLEPEQLAAWISAAPEPQRSALAFFYLNEFSHREMQNLLDVKMNELASLISRGRSQFQAWLEVATAEFNPG